jgi:hypothetical protein
LFVRLAPFEFLCCGRLFPYVLPTKSSNAMLDCLDVIMDEFVELCFRSLVYTRAINRTLDQQDGFAPFKAKKIRGVLFKLCFCYFKD